MEPLKFIEAKGKNKRINIYLTEEQGVKIFLVFTKTLQDRKTRNITETKSVYSVETFAAITDLFSAFMDAGPVKNKLIAKELREMTKFNAKTNIYS